MKYFTFSLIGAALASLVLSCGFDSKPIAYQKPKKSFELSGSFLGNGEVYTTAKQDEIKELHLARAKEGELKAQMERQATVSLFTAVAQEPSGTVIEDESELKLKEELEHVQHQRAELEKMVKLKIETVHFSVVKDEDAKYQIQELVILTNQDKIETLEEEDPDAENIQEERKIRRRYFGDICLMIFSGKALFEPETGRLEFSLKLKEAGVEREYKFIGFEKITKYKEEEKVSIHGKIEIFEPNESYDHSEIVSLGAWRARKYEPKDLRVPKDSKEVSQKETPTQKRTSENK